MRKLFLLSVSVTALFAISCNEKSNIQKALDVERYSVYFEAVANEMQTVKVTAENVDWDVKVASTSSEWLSTEKRDAEHIEISVKDNNTREQRIGKFEVVSSSSIVESRTVTVVQKENPDPQVYTLELDPASLTFQPLNNAPKTVKVTCGREDVEWTTSLENNSDWLTVESEQGKITVSVEDNDEERIRAERVVITPDDPAVESTSFVVEQMPVKVFSVDQKELHYEAYGWALGGTLAVKTVGVDWTFELTNESGDLVDWVTAKSLGTMIEIRVSINNSPSSRTAYLRIIPDTDEFEDIVVVITQSGTGQ